MIDLTPELIEQNYNKFVSFAMKTGEHRIDALKMFFAHFEERLALCPASSRTYYHLAVPGGLVDHSLRVMKNCNRLMQVYKENVDFSQEEMIMSCLFHDIGKLGDVDNERYVAQTNDWKVKQGQVYDYNPLLKYMTTSQMGLFLMQHFEIKLSYNEYMSILLNDGPIVEENRTYAMKEPLLAILVHQADRMACEQEKKG